MVHTGRQRRALSVYAKFISHNMSISALLARSFQMQIGDMFLDHFSVATLGRASIDAALMVMYITEPRLDLDSWNLRRHVLFLHDLCNRKRFLSAASKESGLRDAGLDGYEPSKARLRQQISIFANKLGYDEAKISEFQKGNLVFICGARSAAREAGWSAHRFEFFQSYFSAFVHSHPVSYMRADEHKISFQTPSDFQYDLCRYVLDAITSYSEDVIKRMDAFSVVEGDPLGQVT